MFNKTLIAAGTAAALLAMPMAAQAITVNPGTAATNAVVAISVGDIFQMEINGNASDTADSVAFGFEATTDLLAIETNSVNPTSGFAGAAVEWNTMADGTGTTLASLSGAALLAGDAMNVAFDAGQTLWLIASWSDVTQDLSNFDLRVTASPIPLPAGVLLMGTAMAAFGVARRRKQ